MRRAVGVDGGLVLSAAAKANSAAVAAVSLGDHTERFFDVEPEHLRVQPREGRLDREVEEGVLGRREGLPPTEGPDGERVLRQADARMLLDEDDRLEAVESGEGPGSGFLGQYDRRPTTGVTEGQGVLEAKLLDGRADVVGEARPMEIGVRWWLRATMGAKVDGPAMVTLGQLCGQRGEDGGTEAGGMKEDQVAARPTEVVGRDANPVTCGHPRHRVEV